MVWPILKPPPARISGLIGAQWSRPAFLFIRGVPEFSGDDQQHLLVQATLTHVVDEGRHGSVQGWAQELATGDDLLVVVPAVDVAIRAVVDRDEADSCFDQTPR